LFAKGGSNGVVKNRKAKVDASEDCKLSNDVAAEGVKCADGGGFEVAKNHPPIVDIFAFVEAVATGLANSATKFGGGFFCECYGSDLIE
jgi:hypothetical protein